MMLSTWSSESAVAGRARDLLARRGGGEVEREGEGGGEEVHGKKRPRSGRLRGLSRVAGCRGLEPLASGVTGRRYIQLN